MIEYFSAYAQDGGNATLALMGAKLMPLPEEPFIRFAGRLSEQERLEALEAATVVIVPSPFESLSLLALEAFAVGTPILANARAAVVVDHCRQSNAGLYYADREEFVEFLKLLMVDDRLRAVMGRNGTEYVRRQYGWDTIMSKYEQLIATIRRSTTPGAARCGRGVAVGRARREVLRQSRVGRSAEAASARNRRGGASQANPLAHADPPSPARGAGG